MNFDELQKTWNSPRNNLASEQQQKLAEQFTRQMIRRRRFQTFWLIQTFVWLTLITGLVIWMVAIGKASPAQEWGLFPLLLVLWGFAIHFLRRHLQPVAPIAPGELPVIESVRRALASNQTNQSHLKLVGILYVVMIPLLVLAMQQLHAVGKVSAHELASMAVFFGGVLLIGAAVIAGRYFGRVLPQQTQLKALLTELAGEIS